MPAHKPTTKCPICRKPADFDTPPAGPFCSARCKMLDLGKWLGEDYRISEPLRPDHFEEFEELSGDALDLAEKSRNETSP
ncbi:MAG: DNA gyrase inhibitor YacG [Verrucomicrobia bacterium]|nr:DNA gyrase inhibitor YacG [Verrucomicrobiota bacterium]